MGWGDFTQVDLLAISMLVVMMLSFGVILMLLVSMFRSSSSRDEAVDQLLEEVEEEEKRGKEPQAAVAMGEEAEVLEEWERKADWWKDEG